MRSAPFRLEDRKTARSLCAALAAASAVHAPFSLYQNLPAHAPALTAAALAALFAAAWEPSERSFFSEWRRRAYASWLFAALCFPVLVLAYGMQPALAAAGVQAVVGTFASAWAAVLRRAPWAAVLGVAAALTLAAKALA